jgi:hypothetical protein
MTETKVEIALNVALKVTPIEQNPKKYFCWFEMSTSSAEIICQFLF